VPTERKGSPEESAVELDPRVAWALERTLLAWVRTSLAFMGFGFVVGRFGLFLEQSAAHQLEEIEVSRWLGTTLVVLGVLVQGLALVDYRRQVGRLRRGEAMVLDGWSPGAVLGALLVGIGVGMAVYLASL
jgi:putative membrane protein